MKKVLAAFAVLALAACGEEAPKPAATPVPVTPAPVTQAPPPAPAPEAKAPEAPKADPNKELAQKVKQALQADGKLQAEAIDVTASSGKVTLWGTASTDGERQRAAGVAAKVDGVSGVDNQIKVVKGS
jgi:hypothetical protein